MGCKRVVDLCVHTTGRGAPLPCAQPAATPAQPAQHSSQHARSMRAPAQAHTSEPEGHTIAQDRPAEARPTKARAAAKPPSQCMQPSKINQLPCHLLLAHTNQREEVVVRRRQSTQREQHRHWQHLYDGWGTAERRRAACASTAQQTRQPRDATQPLHLLQHCKGASLPGDNARGGVWS